MANDSHSLLRIVSNEELESKRSKERALDEQSEPQITSLAAHLRRLWDEARNAKNTPSSSYKSIQEQLTMSQRQRRGEYDPDKLSQIREEGGSEVFIELTATKCVAAESWIRDIIMPTTGERAWSIKPSPEPELSPEYEQAIQAEVIARIEELPPAEQMGLDAQTIAKAAEELRVAVKREMDAMAQHTADKMTSRIEDQLVEGNFYQALNHVITDIVTFKNGFLKGPIFRRRAVLQWERNEGRYQPRVGMKIRPEYNRVSPFDIYTSPDSRGINDGYIFERHQMRRKDLQAMKGVPGYSTEAINLVLEEHQMGKLRNWLYRDYERAVAEDRPAEWIASDHTIEALEFYGSVQGSMLLEWGVSESDITNPLDEYEINAWLIGNYVVRAVINKDPLGRRPYHKGAFEEIPGSFWGRGVPEKMRDSQIICNAAARALVNNLAIASGPQAEVFTDRLPPGENITSMYPWKIWQTKSDPTGGGHKAINFFQPQMMANELMRVHDYFSRLADDQTGIPPYTYGSPNVGGAGRTASGLSMLMGSAARGIKQVIVHIDRGIIEPSVERQYQYNMLFDEDESIKGDLEINALGSMTLFAKEQNQVRLIEFLQVTQNPIDSEIMGAEGRADLLRDVAEAMEIPDGIVPDKDELKRRIANQSAQQAEQELAQQEQGQQSPRPQNLDEAGNPRNGQDVQVF